MILIGGGERSQFQKMDCFRHKVRSWRKKEFEWSWSGKFLQKIKKTHFFILGILLGHGFKLSASKLKN